MRDHLDRLTRRWMNKCPSKGEYSFRDKIELNRMEKEMNNLEKRQNGFGAEDKPVLKSMDVSEDSVEEGTPQWHILNLCRVLDYLGNGTIEYDYTVSILEDRLKEYEQDRVANIGRG